MIKSKSYHWWHVAKIGFCFAIFGIGSLSLASIIFPLIAISSKSIDKRKSRARLSIHLSWRFFVFIMQTCNVISIETKNSKNLKNLTGKIIVANHPSLIDIVILISYIPKADCIVKGTLANNFFMKNIVKSLYIINSLNFEEVLLKCDDSLKKGNNLIIFPEGTRTVPDQKSQISRGAAHIAINSKCDILPIKINCYPPGLLKNQKWYNAASEKMEYNLEIKELIDVKEYISQKDDKPIIARHLTDKIKNALEIE